MWQVPIDEMCHDDTCWCVMMTHVDVSWWHMLSWHFKTQQNVMTRQDTITRPTQGSLWSQDPSCDHKMRSLVMTRYLKKLWWLVMTRCDHKTHLVITRPTQGSLCGSYLTRIIVWVKNVTIANRQDHCDHNDHCVSMFFFAYAKCHHSPKKFDYHNCLHSDLLHSSEMWLPHSCTLI